MAPPLLYTFKMSGPGFSSTMKMKIIMGHINGLSLGFFCETGKAASPLSTTGDFCIR
jgi:hypothetical protein